MGRPVPRFDSEPNIVDEMPQAVVPQGQRRPPPLDLRQVPDDDVMRWYTEMIDRLRRLLAHAEDSFPLLARWNRLVLDGVASTPNTSVWPPNSS